jgi:flagellar biosynthetic protein FlhB
VAGKEDRTEAPTQRRKREARRDGQIPRSPDVGTWTAVLVSSFVFPSLLSRVGSSASDSVRALQGLPAAPEPTDAVNQLSAALESAFLATIPLLLVITGTLVVANVAQTGLLFTGKALRPKFSRISPKAGFKQIFSMQSLWETGKSLARVGLLVLIAIPALTNIATGILERGSLDLSTALPTLASQVLRLVRLFAILALALAAVDYLLARRRIGRQIRMTKQELKQEHRNTEGDPHIKAKLRSMRRAFSQNRMIADAATADVIIVNPTHFAVAVKYERTVGVPVIVARGTDKLAQRIRDAGREASVPIVEQKPLARALYWAGEVGETIPRELFEGVARVLAFVYSLGTRAPSSSVLSLPTPLTTEIPDAAQGPGARSRAKAEARRARAAARAIESVGDPSLPGETA